MPKSNNRNIFEERPWLNDDVQNRTVLRQIVGGGSDITVEEVTFTENGDYTAPEGKAYSPVHVDVSGGSSDFSTAEITVTLPADSDAAISVPTIDGPPNMQFLWAATITSSGTKTTALYKGQVMCELVNYEDKTVTVSGDIESMGGSSYIITGDCTITIAST